MIKRKNVHYMEEAKIDRWLRENQSRIIRNHMTGKHVAELCSTEMTISPPITASNLKRVCYLMNKEQAQQDPDSDVIFVYCNARSPHGNRRDGSPSTGDKNTLRVQAKHLRRQIEVLSDTLRSAMDDLGMETSDLFDELFPSH